MDPKVLLGAGVICALSFGYLGFQAYQMTEVAPCVSQAQEQLKALPGRIHTLASKVADQSKEQASEVSEELKAARRMDGFNVAKLGEDASRIKEEGQKKAEATRAKADAEKEDICASVAGSAKQCLGYLQGNIVYTLLAPPSIPSPDQVQGLVAKAQDALETAGCKASATRAAAVPEAPLAPAAGAAALALLAAAGLVAALAARAAVAREVRQEPLLG